MTEGNSKLVVTHIVSGDLWAGAEVQVYNLCRALKASDQITPTAVVFNDGILHDKLKELGMPVSLADESKLGPWAIARSISAHCKEQESEIVHTHGPKENVLGILGKELARAPRSIRTVHGNPETRLSLKRPHKWFANQLDIVLGKLRQQAVVAVSTQLEKKLELLFPGKVHKIFNFIDVDDIRRQWAGKRNLSYENPKIGIIGRLVPVKRVDLFIQTIALLNQNGLECTGVIIGDGPLQQLLTNYAKTLGVTDRIKFMGFMNPSMEALSELDLLLMTSDHEGLPMTLLEALALEIPVVAHNTGGIPEVLDNGHCGWLVDRHEAEGYADIILEILTPSLQNRSEKAEAGLNHLLQVFELEKNICKYIALYQQ